MRAIGRVRASSISQSAVTLHRVAAFCSPLCEVANVLVCLDHVASFIINANHVLVVVTRGRTIFVADAHRATGGGAAPALGEMQPVLHRTRLYVSPCIHCSALPI